MVDSTRETLYHCSIIDGDRKPHVQIVATDVLDKRAAILFETGAWSVQVCIPYGLPDRTRRDWSSVIDPEFLGLGHNTIKHLIQELRGANVLRHYLWQHSEEVGSGSEWTTGPILSASDWPGSGLQDASNLKPRSLSDPYSRGQPRSTNLVAPLVRFRERLETWP
jgi:hypothetical protein